MIPAFLLALREGLEAALIVGIVLGALTKINREDLKPTVWVGTITAVIVSTAAAVILYLVGISFEGAAEQIFEDPSAQCLPHHFAYKQPKPHSFSPSRFPGSDHRP